MRVVRLTKTYLKDTRITICQMPPIYSKNISTTEARERSEAGLSRQVNVTRTNNISHPCFGGSQGYPLFFRRDVLFWEARHGVDFVIRRYNISKASVYRWKIRIEPFQQSGNKPKEEIIGFDQFLLVMCLYIFPRSESDVIAMFIAVNGGTFGISRQAISRRTNELDITRKRASFEAFAAFTPLNEMRCVVFFADPPPVGIRGIPMFIFIDIDEAKFILSKCISKYGRAQTCIRVRDTAHFKKGERGINLLLAVEPGNPALPPQTYGSIQNPRKWWFLTTANVDQMVFTDFIDATLTDIEQNPVEGDEHRNLLWDNLSAHGTGLVTTTVELRPSRPHFQFDIVPRPPYQPK